MQCFKQDIHIDKYLSLVSLCLNSPSYVGNNSICPYAPCQHTHTEETNYPVVRIRVKFHLLDVKHLFHM